MGDIKWHFFEISELKNHQKKSKSFFCSKFSSDCFHLFSCLSWVTLRRRNTFFMEYVTVQTHNHFKSYQGTKIIVSFQNYDNLCQKKKWEFLSKIWTQKFGYHYFIRGLFETVVGLWRDILHKKGVSASKSHRGKHENKWKQSDENFEQNKIFEFFDNFWAQKFRRNVILYPPPKNGFPPTLRWCKTFLRSAMKTNKNSCESWDIGLSNALTLMSIRQLEKKCWALFEKTRALVYPLE